MKTCQWLDLGEVHPQITAIMLLPHFAGVLAPLAFNPVRFEEFTAFTGSLIGTWLGCAYLLGAYRRDATAGAFPPPPLSPPLPATPASCAPCTVQMLESLVAHLVINCLFCWR